ncbi:MAG: radical SAM family heme chaperone HemW [Actinobacteria bacterium]|nr:MAG: radical SAM family heme chaperone HemW [Actinomycetota bacterium]
MSREAAGLYVHVPFCLTRCGYCDFNTYAGLDHLKSGYVDALAAEAEMWLDDWSGTSFVSVFFGGGTPTTLPAATLAHLLNAFRTWCELASGAEITSEANPDTVDQPYLCALLDGGVTRLSMGVQSFDPVVLESLERVHSPDSARRAFAAARSAGFADVNLDLIYGANGESLRSWCRTLEEAVSLGPEHLSCYALTVEPSTPLGRSVAAGLVPTPDADVQAEMYAATCEVLAGAGYEHYEVSNWATPGHRCIHNLGYWEGRPYVGIGAGAHSYRGGLRWWNVRPPAQYLEMVARGERPIGGEERLSDEDRRLERLLLGLRTADGVPPEWVEPDRATEFVTAGLAERRNGRLSLTDRGMFLANDVVLELG